MSQPTPVLDPSARRRLSSSVMLLGVVLALLTAAALAPVGAHAGGYVTAGAPGLVADSSNDSTDTTPPLLPERMATTLDAQQLIVATGARNGSTVGTLSVFIKAKDGWTCTMTVPCKFGKRGLMDGNHRWAGNKATPTGIWRMPNLVFGTHKSAPAGAKMRYRRMTRRSWWSSKRGSTYNRWVEARHWPGEYLYQAQKAYEYAVSTGYNERPNRSVYGRGSGIFLHIKGKGLTAGCVAISRADMIRVAALLDPAKHPAFAIGTDTTGTATSILRY